MGQLITGISMRVGGEKLWGRVDDRMCLMATHVGYVPLPVPVEFRLKDFALRALNQIRSLEKCGDKVLKFVPS